MSGILRGRFTAHTDQPFVVFLIGMRINNLLSFRKWWPVASAMGPMLAELFQHPELGMLSGHGFRSGRTLLMVQYWRSFEHLGGVCAHP